MFERLYKARQSYIKEMNEFVNSSSAENWGNEQDDWHLIVQNNDYDFLTDTDDFTLLCRNFNRLFGYSKEWFKNIGI